MVFTVVSKGKCVCVFLGKVFYIYMRFQKNKEESEKERLERNRRKELGGRVETLGQKGWGRL